MTSEEFHGLVEECSEESEEGNVDAPLTLAEVAYLEREKRSSPHSIKGFSACTALVSSAR
jgi:hypothetical protein